MEKVKKGLLWFLNSYIWLFPLLLALDIVTKQLVVANLELGERVDLIPGFLAITYSINNKAAFSIGFSNQDVNRLIYSIAAVVGCGVALFYYIKKYKKIDGAMKAVLMLIVTGAIGNLIDRSFYSSTFLHSGSDLRGVVDWIDFYGIWGAIFNIADSCIVIAAVLLIVSVIIQEVKENREKKPEKVEQNHIESKTEKSMKIDNKNDEN